MSQVVPVDDTKEKKLERLQVRLQALAAAFDPALEAIDDYSPFYPEDIHAELAKLLQIARAELTEVQTETPFERGWFERGKEHRDQFIEQTNAVAALIRKRIKSLSVNSFDTKS